MTALRSPPVKWVRYLQCLPVRLDREDVLRDAGLEVVVVVRGGEQSPDR